MWCECGAANGGFPNATCRKSTGGPYSPWIKVPIPGPATPPLDEVWLDCICCAFVISSRRVGNWLACALPPSPALESALMPPWVFSFCGLDEATPALECCTEFSWDDGCSCILGCGTRLAVTLDDAVIGLGGDGELTFFVCRNECIEVN